MTVAALATDETLLILKGVFLVLLYLFILMVARTATKDLSGAPQESIVLGPAEAAELRARTPGRRARFVVLAGPGLRPGAAVVLTTGNVVEPRNLPPNVRPTTRPAGMPPIPGSTLADIERYAILETLKATGGSTSKAAEMLGISVRTIQYRLHDYNAAPRSDIAVVAGNGTTK